MTSDPGNPLAYARMYIESKKLFSTPIGPYSIPPLVRGIDVQNGITSLSKAVWILEDSGDLDANAQAFLASQFLQPLRLEKLQQIWRANSAYVLCFRAQLHTLMKYLALYASLNSPPRPVQAEEVHRLGTALLGVTDLIARESVRIRRNLNISEGLEKIATQLIVGEHLVPSRHHLWDAARSKLVYVHLHREVAKQHQPIPDYVDIERAFEQAAGIPLSLFLEIGFGFIANMFRYRDTGSILPNAKDFILFHPLQWFSTSRVDPAAVRALFRVVSMQLDDLKALAASQSSRQLAHDFLPMKERPFLELGHDTYVPVSFDFASERLSTGVYWILFDFLRSQGGDAHLRFSRYNGILFERYVRDIAETLHARQGGSPDGFYGNEVYYVANQEKRTCDALLIGEECIIAIEATASRMTAKRTISDGIADAFKDDCEKVIFRKAEELHNFVLDLKAGKVVVGGHSVITGNRRIYPLIVTMETFPKFPVLDGYLYGELKNRDVLVLENTSPLSVLSAHNLEQVVQDKELILIDVLRAWQSSPNFQYTDLGQFISSTHRFEPAKTSSWYKEHVQRVFDETSFSLFGQSWEQLEAKNSDSSLRQEIADDANASSHGS